MGAAGSLRAAGDAAGRTATSVRRRVSLPILDSYAVTERLLAGEYPGAADAEIAERRMRAFAERGVATFVDLTDLYSRRLRTLCKEVDPSLDEGVYVQFPGPHYETPAEINMIRVMGADLVGMSTVLEAIAAREAGAEVLGISLVTNLAAGLSGEPLNHEEVLQAGRDSAARMGELLTQVLARI